MASIMVYGEWYLSLLALGLFLLSVYLFIQLRGMNEKNNIYELITKASIGGYFVWRKKHNASTISASLLSMLSLKSCNDDFASLARLFVKREQEVLQYFEALQNGTTETIRFNATVYISKSPKEIQCIGYSIINRKNHSVSGVIMWFFDISEYTNNITHLLARNAQLDEELNDYSKMFNSLPIPVWKRDRDFYIKFCNLAYSQFVNMEGGNVNNTRIPELDQNLRNMSMLAAKNKRPFNMKKHIVVQGQRKFFSINEVPVKSSENILGFACDITDQDEIEKELARHISAHADLLDSSSSAMAVYGADTKLQLYNNAFVNLWDLSLQWLDTHPTYGEVIEVLREQRKLPEQADFMKFRKEQIQLFTDTTSPNEEIMHLPNGKSIRIIVIPNALGGLLFAYEDVTDHLVMERSFNAMITLQRETLNNLSQAVALFGEDGKVRLYNPLFLQIWNSSSQKLDNKPHIRDIISHAEQIFIKKSNWEMFVNNITDEILERNYSVHREKLRNGNTIDIVSRPLQNGDTLLSCIDVTDSIKAEQALIDKNKILEDTNHIKEDFLEKVAFGLRMPLTSIIGYINSLSAVVTKDVYKNQIDYIGKIQDASMQILKLLNDVFAVTAISPDKISIKKDMTNISVLINDVIARIIECYRIKNIQIDFDNKECIEQIIIDDIKIRYVIFNILSKFVQFTEDRGHLLITLQLKKNHNYKITLEDKKGKNSLSNQNKKQLLQLLLDDPMQQHLSDPIGGPGFVMVREILRLHNGSISLKNNGKYGVKIVISIRSLE